MLLVNTLYAVCKPQADERDVSDEAFGELLVGDTIELAAAALVRGITDFFPKDRRAVLDRLWAATKRTRTRSDSDGDGQAGLTAGRAGDHGSDSESERRDRPTAAELWRYVWELAGILGVEPGPLTLRELVWMYAARRRERWSHTANVMALMANCHRDPKRVRRPFDMVDFLPADLATARCDARLAFA